MASSSAEEVLSDFRYQFIEDMDANTVVWELLHKNIISRGVQERIARTDELKRQNEILHDCLQRMCTKEALMEVCDIIVSMRGLPKMRQLGEAMKRRLQTATPVQVIQDHAEQFLKEMNSKVLAPQLKTLGLIPAVVENDVLQSRSREEANANLLQHLKENADMKSVMEIFRIASQKPGYGRMNTLADGVLRKLQRESSREKERESGEAPGQTTSKVSAKAEEVLDVFRDQFIADVDANAVLMILLHNDIISERAQQDIVRTGSRRDQNAFLHHCLRRTCTKEALMEVCDIFVSVRGNPKMRVLGEAMKSRLQTAPSVVAAHLCLESGSTARPVSLKTQAPTTGGEMEVTQSRSEAAVSDRYLLSQPVHCCKRYAVLFRKHVSRQGAGKGKAILECVGLTREQIQLCYQSNPRNEEEAIQDGLKKWQETQGDNCTWQDLLEAMTFAGISEQHCSQLVQELHQWMQVTGREEVKEEKTSREEVNKEFHPMSPWNHQALVSLRADLMLHVLMETGFGNHLEMAAGGFMTRLEAQTVRAQPSNIKQMDKVFDILLGKADKDFTTFLKMLRDSNNVVWAEELEKKAEQFRKEVTGREEVKEEKTSREEVNKESLDVLKFQEQYSEVVRNQASVTLKITKCTTIGPPRIGTTCFKNLLIGQEWDVEAGTASTDVMEAPEWVECYSLEDDGAEELWKLVSKEQQKGELIRAVNESTMNSTQLPTPPSDAQDPTKPSDMTPSTDAAATPSKVDHQTTPSGTESRNTHDSAHPPTSKSDATRRPTVRQALEALAGACSSEDLQDYLKDKQGKVLGKRRLIHFIDTGGQSIYHDIHPVLITSPSIYLVVFSLKDFKEKNYEGRLSYFRSDLIQRPLRSIYTFGRKTPKVENYLQLHPEAPKIFIVGTHLDQIPPDSQDQFLHELHKMIEGEISSKPYRQFVQYDVKFRSFWAVDTRQAGKEQDEDTKEYISTLRLMVQDRSMEMSVQVPLPWMLLKMVMDGQGVHYCKYSELLKVACNLGYVREDSAEADLDIVLWLFHILGLMYHKVPSECKKEDSLVFIDPGCLYSATSDFLMAAKEEIEDSSEEGQHQTQTASTEETEDNQGDSGEGQHQTQAASTKKTEDNQRGSEEGQHQTPAASTEETEDNQRGSEEGQHQTQASSTEETEDNQGGSEEGQQQTQAASTEETEDNQGGSEEGQHQTQAASTEETEDNQGGSEEGQHQTQASSTEETEDNQRGNEKGQHQTQAASTEETEDNQRGSEEGQNQTQASSTEETEDNQRGSEESQHQAQASSTEETEDNQRGSEEGQHQTQAASTEETEDNQRGSEEGQHQTQAVSTEETEDNQRGSEEGRLHIVKLTTEEDPFDMNNYQEAPDLGALTLRRRGSAASQKLKHSATVQKNLRGGAKSLKVSERIRNSMRDFLFDMQRVLHSLAHVVMKVGMEPPDKVLLNLEKIQQGVEENTCSDDASTLQSKYRILAHEIVFKLMKSIRKVLERSTSEGRKPQLDSIMKDFWFHCGMTRRSIEMDDFNHLLLLLTELRIIAKLDQQDCYLIPAALPRHRDQMFLVARGIEPLLFTLTSQDDLSYYLPSGLFCCLISELVTGLRWTVVRLSRTHVAFRHKNHTGVVHLIESESYIEIQLEPTLQANVDCNSIREQIDERINNVYDMIYDPPESRRPVVGFKCNCGCGPAHAPHFAAYEEDEFESCLRCLLQGSTELYVCPLTQQQLVWFPRPAVAGMQ